MLGYKEDVYNILLKVNSGVLYISVRKLWGIYKCPTTITLNENPTTNFQKEDPQ